MSSKFNEMTEYVSVVTQLDDADLYGAYRLLVNVVNDYMDRERASDDLIDDFEVLMMYFGRLDEIMSKARELDVAKELRFLKDNVAMYGHFNGEDRISMLVSLLTTSITRLRDKTARY